MTRITLDYLRARHACWSDDRIRELLPPEGCTPLELAECDAVPVADRLWVLLHPSILPDRTLVELAARWAAQALRAAGVEDVRSWRAVWTAAQYAHGCATWQQLRAAAAAVAYAAVAAARAADVADVAVAAYDAAVAAARAGDVAYVAVAAYDAAVAAARAADVARDSQIADVIRNIRADQ